MPPYEPLRSVRPPRWRPTLHETLAVLIIASLSISTALLVVMLAGRPS